MHFKWIKNRLEKGLQSFIYIYIYIFMKILAGFVVADSLFAVASIACMGLTVLD